MVRLPIAAIQILATLSLTCMIQEAGAGTRFRWRFGRAPASLHECAQEAVEEKVLGELIEVREVTNPTFVEDLGVDAVVKTALPRAVEPAPEHEIEVREYQSVARRYSHESPEFLVVHGLDSCASIAVYDPVTKTGLLRHFVTLSQGLQRSLQIGGEVGRMKEQFAREGGKWSRAQVTVVWGSTARNSGTPVIHTLLEALHTEGPARLTLDSQTGRGLRSVLLDLWNGRVLELFRSQSALDQSFAPK
ncbi:MAG TPA: hypothetical protein VM598_00405 [Bdellovibrionota bacterium]|nr:hypothetical protein [Bdellovibrionota bacterium]